MKKLNTITCIVVLLAGISVLPSKGSVIFNGTTWYDSGTSASLTVDGGTMSSTTASGNFVISYITPSGSPLSLTANQTLTYTVDFSIVGSAASATGLRFGLFNSGGSRISADNLGLSSATYANYTGYAAAFGNNNVTTGVISSALWDRTNTPNNALISTSGVFASDKDGTTPTSSTPPLTSGTPYRMTLSLTYNSTTDMTVTSTLTGSTLPVGGIIRSYTDTTPVTSFDTVVLYSTSSMSTGLNFTNVAVSVVPEPSTTISLLLGAIGLLIVQKSRRLRSMSRAHL
jgi:hypothetical protein